MGSWRERVRRIEYDRGRPIGEGLSTARRNDIEEEPALEGTAAIARTLVILGRARVRERPREQQRSKTRIEREH